VGTCPKNGKKLGRKATSGSQRALGRLALSLFQQKRHPGHQKISGLFKACQKLFLGDDEKDKTVRRTKGWMSF